MKRPTVALCLLLTLVLPTAFAQRRTVQEDTAQQEQIGADAQEPKELIGIITVIDPKNLFEGIKRLKELRKQVSTLRNQYDQLRRTYDLHWVRWSHYFRQTRQLKNLARYRVKVDPWKLSEASTDVFGKTAGWLRGVNHGINVDYGYGEVTIDLDQYGQALNRVPAQQLERLMIRYSAVELADAANRHGLKILGGVRRHARESREALEALDKDTHSDTWDRNTQIALLNKINAASMAALRSEQETNKLLTSLLEQQLVQSRARRDVQVVAINRNIAFRRDARQIVQEGLRGTSEALSSFRLP